MLFLKEKKSLHPNRRWQGTTKQCARKCNRFTVPFAFPTWEGTAAESIVSA